MLTSTRLVTLVRPAIEAIQSDIPNNKSVIAKAKRIWFEAVLTREKRQKGTMTRMLEANVSGARPKAKVLRLMTIKVSSALFPTVAVVLLKLMIFKKGK